MEAELYPEFMGSLDDPNKIGVMEGFKPYCKSNSEAWCKLENAIKKEADRSDNPYFELNEESDVAGAKLVIIDECSMVDATLGKDLLSFGTKVLVLGDPAQLPPVYGAGYFTKDVKPNVMLTEIHRQALDSPVLQLATDTRLQKTFESGYLW